MQYEDRVTVSTPEGVDLALELAGIGSRFLADAVDGMIRIVPIVIIAVAAGAVGDAGIAIGTVVIFLLVFAYDVLFETRNGGRTPGKKAAGLRVVTETGGAVDFRSSAIRNLLRLVDALPGVYLVGIAAILATKRNQRLGDLAARTLVIREPVARSTAAPTPVPGLPIFQPSIPEADWDLAAITTVDLAAGQAFLERRSDFMSDARSRLAESVARGLRTKVPQVGRDLPDETVIERVVALAEALLLPGRAAGWNVSGVTSEEMVAVRRFLERRRSLDAAARQRLASTLNARIRPKVLGVEDDVGDERFLEQLAAAKAART